MMAIGKPLKAGKYYQKGASEETPLIESRRFRNCPHAVECLLQISFAANCDLTVQRLPVIRLQDTLLPYPRGTPYFHRIGLDNYVLPFFLILS